MKLSGNSELIIKIESFADHYQKIKLQKGLADYDDLLVYWLQVLENNSEASTYYQERFSHVLVDEYQDVNCLQAQIVDKIASSIKLWQLVMMLSAYTLGVVPT